jgi:hypothetical protein
MTYDLLTDGDMTVVVVPADSYDDFIWGCLDADCKQIARAIEYGRSVVSAMREDNGHPVVYRMSYTDGLELQRCSLDVASSFCPTNFSFFPNPPGPTSDVSALAIKKGLTPDDDVVYIGWTTGEVQTVSVSDCLAENCNPTTIATVIDGIGQPTEVGNLRFQGDDLYWLTAEESGNGSSFKAQTCSTASTCTASTFFTGHSFYVPQMAIGGGKMFISDDGNVWSLATP